MIACVKRAVYLLIIPVLVNYCTNSVVSDTGGASETIAIIINNSTIHGKVAKHSENGQSAMPGLHIKIYEDDYITFVDSASINFVDSTVSDSNGEFRFTGIKTGNYNLYAQNMESGNSVFIESIVMSGSSDTLYDTLTTPGSLSGIVKTVKVVVDSLNDSLFDTASASLYDVYIPGSPFVSAAGTDGDFIMNSISKGMYNVLSMRAQSYIDSSSWNSMDSIISVINNAQGKAVTVQSGVHYTGIQIFLGP
jgi:hypothetical protein